MNQFCVKENGIVIAEFKTELEAQQFVELQHTDRDLTIDLLCSCSHPANLFLSQGGLLKK